MVDRELKEKLDAVFNLQHTWAGTVVCIQERFIWETAQRRWGTRYPVVYLQGILESVGLLMCGGTVSFSFQVGEMRAEFGVILSKLVSIEFASADRVEFVEQHDPHVWGRVQLDRIRAEPAVAEVMASVKPPSA
jgi:hypothetical protein